MNFLDMVITASDIKKLRKSLTEYNAQSILFDLSHLDQIKYHTGFNYRSIWMNTINEILNSKFNIETTSDAAQWVEGMDIPKSRIKKAEEMLNADNRYMFYVPFKSFIKNGSHAPVSSKAVDKVLKFIIDDMDYGHDYITDIDCAKNVIIERYNDLIKKAKVAKTSKEFDKILTDAQYTVNDCDLDYNTMPDEWERQWVEAFDDIVDEQDFTTKPHALYELHQWMNPASGLMENCSSDYVVASRDLPAEYKWVSKQPYYWFNKNDNVDEGDFKPTNLVASKHEFSLRSVRSDVIDLLIEERDTVLGL